MNEPWWDGVATRTYKSSRMEEEDDGVGGWGGGSGVDVAVEGDAVGGVRLGESLHLVLLIG